MSLAWAGSFLTSQPPGKSHCSESFKKVEALSECEKCRVTVENLRKRDNTILLTQHTQNQRAQLSHWRKGEPQGGHLGPED